MPNLPGRATLRDVSGSVLPKAVVLAPPRAGDGIASRYLAPTSCHATHALTGAATILAAVNVGDSTAACIASPDGEPVDRIVIERPSGCMEVECDLAGPDGDGLPVIRSASVTTTSRPLFTGNVYVRDRLAVA
jgi:4-oxalomesaconate tautomerase